VSSRMPITECVGNKSDNCVIDPCLLDGWSSLHYVDVEVEGLSYPLSALQDSGCELCYAVFVQM